jgi:hypothetical protein
MKFQNRQIYFSLDYMRLNYIRDICSAILGCRDDIPDCKKAMLE